MLATVLGIVAPLFGLILLGFVSGKKGWLPAASTPALNAFTVYLGLPALLFRVMSESKPAELWQPGFLLAFSTGTAVAFLLALMVDRRRHRSASEAAIDALIASYPNTGFLGIPLGLAAFGHPGLQAALIASVIPVAIVFAIGIMVMEFDINHELGFAAALRLTMRRLLTNPLILSPSAGIAWQMTGLGLPDVMRQILVMLGDTAVPCALVNLGLFLSESAGGGHGRAGWLIGIKLLVQPAVTALMALVLLRMEPVWSSAAILLAALPTGTGPFMLATHYRLDSGVSARATLLSTLLSVATVTALLIVLHR